MPPPDPARPLHRTMLGVLDEGHRQGLTHTALSLPECRLLLELHSPGGFLLGDPCAACAEPWPCTTVMAVLGGLVPAPKPGTHSDLS